MRLRAFARQLLGARGSFKLDTAISMSAGIASRIITLASLPVIAHYYAPADLGLWAIVLSLTMYFTPFATLRYDIAIVIAPVARMGRALVLAMLTSMLAVAAALAVAVAIAPARFWHWISGLEAANQGLLIAMPPLLLLLVAQIVLQAYLTRRRRFVTLGVSQIAQAVVTPAATLGLLWIAPASSTTAAAGAMLGFAASIAAMIPDGWRDLAPSKNRGWTRLAYRAAWRFWVYPAYMLPYTLSTGLAERVLQVVFATFYSVASLGAFALARQIMLAPSVFLSTTMRQVMFAHSAQEAGPAARRERVLKVLRVLIGCVGPATGFAAVWLVPLLTWLLPPNWAAVAHYGWWFLWPASLHVLMGWLDRMMDVLGRQRLNVALQLATDAACTAVVVAAAWLEVDALHMVAALSLATAAANIGWLVVTLRLLGSEWPAIAKLVAGLVGNVVVWGGLQWILHATLPPAAALVIGLALLGGGVAMAAMRLKPAANGD